MSIWALPELPAPPVFVVPCRDCGKKTEGFRKLQDTLCDSCCIAAEAKPPTAKEKK